MAGKQRAKRKPKEPAWANPALWELTREPASRLAIDLVRSQFLRRVAANQTPPPMRIYDPAEHQRFVARFGRPRPCPLRAMPPVRTVAQQIAALLVED